MGQRRVERGVAALARREEAWRGALATAPTERLFLEPEWLVPWLEVYGREPWTLFVAERDGPCAAATLVRESIPPIGPGARILRPPGLGVSDYLDLVLPPERSAAERACATLLDGLVEAGGWDLLDLPNLPTESPTADLLAGAARRRGLPGLRCTIHGRPFVRLEANWAAYLASRPQKLRYNLRARRRQLARLGGELRYGHYTRPDEVEAVLQSAVEIHARRWRGQHTGTTFSRDPTARRFYAAALPRMARRGWVDLSTLELDGRLLAFCLAFVYDEKLYYYLPAFDPAYARYGPSTDLLAHLIEMAFARGIRELDFMLGDEPYKQPWATDRRTTTRLVVAAPTARGRAALRAFRLYLTVREQARRSSRVQRLRRHGLGKLRQLLAPWTRSRER